MKKIWLYVATALMLIRGGYEIGKHEHVHHELPRQDGRLYLTRQLEPQEIPVRDIPS